ncbi:hypothetical protein HNR63_001048 [Anoxybacillus kamchatkensis]|uniref:hypothetical protein n=1 Tax=Anoxybacillus ayderensis TaxID=265546 RepID=UPI0015EB906F|nr:hypothetical protein [Anoxybacillus ayderensis]MBA2877994.1 hypothetical protein [Anoxybacillus ayderensis]
MEQAIRFRIDLAKKHIERMQQKVNESTLDTEKNFLQGYIIGLQHELSTLEDMLLVWNHMSIVWQQLNKKKEEEEFV